MADDNSSSGSHKGNPDQDSNSNTVAKDDSSVETIAQKYQDSLSIGKKHAFWETQPVGQFKDSGNSSVMIIYWPLGVEVVGM